MAGFAAKHASRFFNRCSSDLLLNKSASRLPVLPSQLRSLVLTRIQHRAMAQAAKPKAANYKRLIVLCDGTWQDSNTDKVDFPTNVTRFARALRPTHNYVFTHEDGHKTAREVPQIVFYQPGPGSTGETRLRGGIYGHGVSAIVRAVYAFLAHNYSADDDIFFFGFSRGAYIARSVAGIVTSLGLLNKRGMDQFPLVYDTYYKHTGEHMSADHPEVGKGFDETHSSFITELENKGYLHKGARAAVKIIGVWDTVGFHWSGWGEEKIEFHNVTLSPLVRHAFHALALDETRWPFKPTPWRKPGKEATERGKKILKKIAADTGNESGQTGSEGRQDVHEEFDQELQQVWFSGQHSDIGGGLKDPRLSDIALAWMIASCHGTGLLDFTDLPPQNHTQSGSSSSDTRDNAETTKDAETKSYLLSDSEPQKSSNEPWSTSAGAANPPEWFTSFIRQFYSEDREPLTITDAGTGYTWKINDGSTQEFVHESIRDRKLADWTCPALSGQWEGGDKKTLYKLKDPERQKAGFGLKVAPLVKGEEVFKGRIKGIQEDKELKEAAGKDEKKIQPVRKK